MNSKQTIVVPWDFSDQSQSALDFAIENYSSNEVRVICVIERPNAYEMVRGGEEAEQKAAQSCVADFYDTAKQAHENGLQFFAKFGDPSDEIIRFAKEHNAGVIVMPTHGRTGLRKLFMGSVAQKVIGKASCPVVALPIKWVDGVANSSKTKPNIKS